MKDRRQYRTLLLEVGNQIIDNALISIEPDFTAITKLLREGHAKVTASPPCINVQLNEILKELQFFDILKQKFDHIKQVHRLIINTLSDETLEPLTPNAGPNLIRLNALQFKLAILDYLSAVNHIQRCLENHDLYKLLGASSPEALFRSSSELLSVNRRMNEWFIDAEKVFEHDACVALPHRVAMMEQMYSTESERMVLKAYYANPLLSENELQPLQEQTNTEIDLF